MNIQELREKNNEELNNELLKLRKEQFGLRMQKGDMSKGSTKTHLFRYLRRSVAQIKTILNEKVKQA